MGELTINQGTAEGTFSLDGETHQVENNIWVLGTEDECFVIDAPHDVDRIMQVVGDRTVLGILCTHGHDDHIRQAPALRERTGAPVYLHHEGLLMWRMTHPANVLPDRPLADGETLEVDGHPVEVFHTPGHSPGGCCFYVPDLNVVFTGDTLFHGGPGATGRSHSDRGQLEDSIRRRLFVLPDDTVVHPGHGESTTIGAEADALGR